MWFIVITISFGERSERDTMAWERQAMSESREMSQGPASSVFMPCSSRIPGQLQSFVMNRIIPTGLERAIDDPATPG